VVENLTLRYVQLRDFEGNVHFVPNGEIAVVTNSSRTFSFAVMDVMIALDQEIEPVIAAMREIGTQMRAHAEWGPRILDELELAGIESWNERGITLRARFRVPAVDQGPVRREFLMRLKCVFDAQKIRQPQMMVSLVGGQPTAPVQ
jgi:small conductance mechanosensitive channel